jgi:threonine dehydrogenase-like Zn-dependent dehydrogenase
VGEDGRHIFRSGILPGGAACVIGSGTVSLIYAALAVLEGAARVVVLVRSESKAQQVRDLLGSSVEVHMIPRLADDASAATLAAEDQIVRELADLTRGHLFDDVVVASASPAAQRLMLRLYTREGYAVGACFGGTHMLVDAADLDVHHYRAATTIGSSGCSTDCMKTIRSWLESGRLRLRGFISPRRFTLDDDPHEFFTTDAGGLKPALSMAEGDR